MAIRINIESQDTCWRAYLNYHCYGNTMNISPEEMGAIINRWGDQIPMWQENANTKDEVKYKFDDSEFENIKTESYSNTKDQYGDDVNTKGEKARAVADGVTTGVSGVAATGASLVQVAGAGKIAGKLGKVGDFLNGGLWNITKGSGEAAKSTKATVGSWMGFIMSAASCIMSFIVGLMAKNKIANKEEHAAVMELQNEMGTQQEALTTEADNMAKYEEEIIKLSDEAQEANEASAQNIEGQKTSFDMSNRVYLNLRGKLQRGEALTAGERALYNKSVSTLQTTSSNIDLTITDTTEVLQTKGAEIAAYEGKYDMAVETIAEVQGVTDYAAEIDEITQKNCDSEKRTQTWNATFAGIAAGTMIASTVALAAQYALVWPVAVAIGVAGAALTALAVLGTVWSGKAAAQQGEMSAQVGEEIVIRQSTQDMNADTQEIYDEQIDAFDGTLDFVTEGLKVIEPENTNAPENVISANSVTTPKPEDKPKKKPSDE